MPSVSAMLIAASALVILSLGALHLFFTYHGPAFHPRSAQLYFCDSALSTFLSPICENTVTAVNPSKADESKNYADDGGCAPHPSR